MPQNDGGPAYPVPLLDECHEISGVHNGMSLRDWFAGQALQRLIGFGDPDPTAREAYRHADAMLAAREGGDAE